MPRFNVWSRLLAAVTVAGIMSARAEAQEASVLPPLFDVSARWDTPPQAWVDTFIAAGWVRVPARSGAVNVEVSGNWLGYPGVLSISPVRAGGGQVEVFSFESPLRGLDSAVIRDGFLAVVDSLTARLGPPTGWGLGGLNTRAKMLSLGVLWTVWRKTGTSGDYLSLEAIGPQLELSVRSASYQAWLEAKSHEARLRWEAEERKKGPIVDPSHIYESGELTSQPRFMGCSEKAPRTGLRGHLTITTVIAPWGRHYAWISLAALDAPFRVRDALEDWINQYCHFVGGHIDGTFVYSRLRFMVSIDR